MVYGHRKCFGGYRVHIGSPEGVPGTPNKDMGLMGQEGKRSSQQGLLHPPYRPNENVKERGEERKEGEGFVRPLPSFPLLLPPPPKKYGERGGGELD